MAWAACIDLHVTDWMTTQNKDPTLKAVINWFSDWKVWHFKCLLGDDENTEEGKTILWAQKLIPYQGALYHCHTLTGELEEVLQFMVPKAHWVAATNGCHHDARHQSQQQTLSLQNDQFWWPGMAFQMQRVISICEQCIQHEGIQAIAPVQPIIVTTSLELLHVDFTSIETMMELDQPPNVVNLLVFCNHLWSTSWHMWPLIKLQRLLLSFCGKATSRSLEHWPNSWVTEGPTLKATSSESFVSIWTEGRLGLHLTMLKPMDRWNELMHIGNWVKTRRQTG